MVTVVLRGAGVFNGDGTGILAHGFTGALHIWRRLGDAWVPKASTSGICLACLPVLAIQTVLLVLSCPSTFYCLPLPACLMLVWSALTKLHLGAFLPAACPWRPRRAGGRRLLGCGRQLPAHREQRPNSQDHIQAARWPLV